jgi:hypothetical protein
MDPNSISPRVNAEQSEAPDERHGPEVVAAFWIPLDSRSAAGWAFHSAY